MLILFECLPFIIDISSDVKLLNPLANSNIFLSNDIVVFQSEQFKDDLVVTGEIRVRLWASSSALDTDFTAKLIDVYTSSKDYPGGFDLNIGDGIMRARFRDSCYCG